MLRAYKSAVLLILAQFALGSGGTLVRLASAQIDPVMVGAIRFGLVAAGLSLLYPVRFNRGTEWRLFFVGVFFVQQFAFWYSSIARLPLGVASLLCGTSPIWCALFETLFQRAPPTKRLTVAIVVATAGLALICQASASSAALDGIGIVYGVGAGMGIACTMLIMRNARLENHASLALMGRSTCYTAAILGGVAWLRGVPLPPLSHWQPYAAATALAVVCQGIGCCLQVIALQNVRASVVGLSTLLGPVLASIYGALFFDERLSKIVLVGGALILAAVLSCFAAPRAEQSLAQ